MACLGLFTLSTAGLSTEDSYTKEFDSIKGQKVLVAHGLLDASNTVQIVANTDDIDAVVASIDDVDGLGEPTEAQPISDTRSYFEATIDADISSSAAFDIVEDTRDAVHGVDGADAIGRRRVRVLPGHQDRGEPGQPGDHPDRPASWCC